MFLLSLIAKQPINQIVVNEIQTLPNAQLPASHPDSRPSTAFFLPRVSLSGCVLGVVIRDTRHLTLTDAQRYNYFPATPMCTLTWFFEGCGNMVEPPQEGAPGAMLPNLIFSGPFQTPPVSWNPGPVHVMMLVLYPEAVTALTGRDMSAYLDQTVPAEEVLDSRWLELCEDVFRAPSDADRFALIQERLDAWWQSVRPAGAPAGNLMEDWFRAITLRAATSGFGRSVRQVERRIRAWTGQTHRELQHLIRIERLYFNALSAREEGKIDWAGMADDAGFSDQSHMSRQLRRLTGFPPAQIMRLIEEDEAFWPYRVLAERRSSFSKAISGASKHSAHN
ncbi:AraC family transcriptional regulator [Noviherbaspirillum sp. UKPF54]|uniref:helix-turn-helix domain-containing protein n=1 Tax=Noviherbaspirillum sp. UKPF54 TaxID=2601898 RepID=UPI0011B185EF|nr:AraC family transcriptional regulator [Noviherbaspirillum sp. UKPF54]QDZ29325.1 helix-turn-helix transcriptional regulator [Noviherbaspirillum sp. UKPF54]